MNFKRAGWLLMGAGAGAVTGCGGGGSAPASVESVTPLALRTGDQSGEIYAIQYGIPLGSITTTSPSRNQPFTVGAYWPKPSQAVVIPYVDPTTQSEYVSAISSDGSVLAGGYRDIGDTGNGARGFVYHRKTQKFSILSPPNTTFYIINPTAVDSAGNVQGVTYGEDDASGQFSYNAARNSYLLSSIPSYSIQLKPPSGGKFPEPFGYSQNFNWVYGFCSFGTQNRAVIWNNETFEGEAIGLPTQNCQALSVANDGRTALYLIDEGLSETTGTWLWREHQGSQSVLQLIQRYGIGANWLFVTEVVMSDDGSYLGCTGVLPGGLVYTPIIIRLR